MLVHSQAGKALGGTGEVWRAGAGPTACPEPGCSLPARSAGPAATAWGGGRSPKPRAAPREGTIPLLGTDWEASQGFEDLFHPEGGGGGDKTGEKLHSHRDVFTASIIPKVTAWRRGTDTATDVRTPRATAALPLPPTAPAAQRGFKARANHLPVLAPLPHVPRPARRGRGMKPALLQRSARLTPLLLLQLHLNFPPSPNGTDTWIPAPHGEGETGGDWTRA